ncbi:MAG: PAS domain S-box protein, partial [Desulfosudaceae bacterium]
MYETYFSLVDYAAEHSLEEVLTRALDEISTLMDSPIGFYHFVAADQKTLYLQQWSTRTRAEFCRAQGRGLHYSVDLAGVWVDCVHQKKPVIHNDYAGLSHKKGLPAGHVPVTRELVVPVTRQGEVLAVLGVGNKPEPYTARDADLAAALADITWGIVSQKRTEAALRERIKELDCLYGISRLVETSSELADILQGTTALLPPAWQYPDITRARITLAEEAYHAGADCAGRCDNCPHARLTQTLTVHEDAVGEVRICYLDKRPPLDEGPFLREERRLLDLVAERLGRILERFAIRRALRESEEKHRTTVNAIGDAVIATDAAGRVTQMNPVAEALTGWPLAEAWQRPAAEIFHIINTRDRQPAQDPITRVLRTRQLSGLAEETLLIARDGKERPIADSAAPVYTDKGECSGAVLVFRDVSAEHEALTALRESEAKFFKSFHTAPYAQVLTRVRDGRIIEANRAFGTLTGYTPEELLGRSTLELPLWEDERERHQVVRDLLQGNPVLNRELVFRNRKKEAVTGLFSAETFFLDEEICILASINDISERKRIEEERERYFHELELINQTFITISRMDDLQAICQYLADQVQAVNPEAVVAVSLYDMETDTIRIRSLSGLEPFTEVLRDMIDFNPLALEFSAADMSWNVHLYTTGRLETIPGGLYPLLGQKIPRNLCREFEHRTGLQEAYSVGFALDEISVGGLSLLLPAGRPVRLRHAIETIASNFALLFNRLKAEATLRKNENQKNLILNATNEIVIYYDTERRVIWANRRAAAYVGKETRELIGRPCYEIWQQRRTPCPECSLLQALTDGRPKACEQQTPDGCWWLLRGYPVFDDQGRVTALVQFGQEVTEQKKAEADRSRLEEELSQSRKLKSIGRLAGGIAHDLNNLLSPILGYGEMLLAEHGTPAERERFLREIVKAGTRAQDLVRQILAFSRKQTLAVAPVNLNLLLEDFIALLRRTIRENITIDLDLAPDLPEINGDAGQLEQIIMNLAVNAQDAMPHGGRLTFATSVFVLEENDQGRYFSLTSGTYARLTVRDTGCGMDEITRANLFEPFFTTKETGQGTGMGLATVYGIVKQHGGDIRAKSLPGQGATFTILLPVPLEPAPAVHQEAASSAPSKGSETILLVEDNEPVRMLATDILKEQGYQVLAAAEGKAALALAEKHQGPLDLLLTDVIMPEMNGKQLYERL